MKAKNPFVSVVILNHNGLEYLKKTVPPLLDLNYSKYEILVVDNDSSDGSVQFLKQFNVKIIKNSFNYGYSKGKNIGARNAKGKYILLLDEDIFVNKKNILMELVDLMENKNDVFNISILLTDKGDRMVECYGGFYNLYGLKQRKKMNPSKILKQKDKLIEIAAPDGGALFFKKDIFEKVGGYDESQPYFLDVGDYGIRGVILTGKKNYLYTKANFIHLGAKRKINNDSWCWKYKYVFSGLSKIIIKNYRLKNIVMVYPFFILFIILKTIKQLIFRRDLRVMSSLFYSIRIFFKDFPNILKQRKEIQSKRVIKEDIFLKIKVPEFE